MKARKRNAGFVWLPLPWQEGWAQEGGEALEAEALDGREGLQVAGMLLCL